MEKARILVLTGEGKGKTTSALGMLLRALGHGRKALLVRFCKAAPSGELAALGRFAESGEFAIHSGDCGMTPPRDHPDFPRHAAAARRLFAIARAAAPGYGMIVLDEICGAVSRGLLEEGDVIAFLGSLGPEQAVILTGRDAGARILAAADTVSEIRCVKHGHAQGIPAWDGIER